MTLQLGEYLEWGELRHSASNTVHGFLQLRDTDVPIYIELTGHPSDDLAGKAWRFLPHGAKPSVFEAEDPALLEELLSAAEAEIPPEDPTAKPSGTTADLFDLYPPPPSSRLPFRIHPHQVGATGKMTADCYVQTSGELSFASPRLERALYLEWFSQNGRVVLELISPFLEVADARVKSDDETAVWDPLPEPVVRQELCRESTLADYFRELEDGEPHPGADLPDDRDLSSEEFIAQLEFMDDCYTSSGGDSLAPLIREFVPSAPLNELSDEEVDISLKYALAQLALRGVAIHPCEHDTPRTLFQYIRTVVAEEGEHYPPLRNTPFVQHYLTGESCTLCLEELENGFSSDPPA